MLTATATVAATAAATAVATGIPRARIASLARHERLPPSGRSPGGARTALQEEDAHGSCRSPNLDRTISALRPLVGRIAQHDRSLAKQLQAAASSIALNIGEARYSDPGNRRARFHSAAGSAGETRTALEVAVAWGYITPAQAQSALGLLDRVLAMLWRLGRGR